MDSFLGPVQFRRELRPVARPKATVTGALNLKQHYLSDSAKELCMLNMRHRPPLLRHMAKPWPVRCSFGVSSEKSKEYQRALPNTRTSCIFIL